MKINNVEQFVALRAALQQEKATIEARLAEITRALSAPGAATPVVAAPGKRHFSAATKAKMAAAQKARWAKLKGKAAVVADPAPKKKHKMSAAGRAANIAATKARWAKVKAGKAK